MAITYWIRTLFCFVVLCMACSEAMPKGDGFRDHGQLARLGTYDFDPSELRTRSTDDLIGIMRERPLHPQRMLFLRIISERGVAAIPKLRAAAVEMDDARAASTFLGAIALMPGVEASSALLSVALGENSFDEKRMALGPTSSAALGSLLDRELPQISDEQVKQLERILAYDESVSNASVAARILARSRAPKEVISNIIERLVATPPHKPISMFLADGLDAETSLAYRFLVALSEYGSSALPYLSAQEKLVGDDDEHRTKWLILARGFAGDPSRQVDIERILRLDQDPYVRCVALRAHRYLPGVDLHAVAKAYINDTTEARPPHGWNGGPFFPVRECARELLTDTAR